MQGFVCSLLKGKLSVPATDAQGFVVQEGRLTASVGDNKLRAEVKTGCSSSRGEVKENIGDFVQNLVTAGFKHDINSGLHLFKPRPPALSDIAPRHLFKSSESGTSGPTLQVQ